MYDVCAYNNHGAPSLWRVVNRHHDEFGTCHAHLAPTLVVLASVMSPSGPLIVEPIFSRWGVSKCANCGTVGPPDVQPDQRWLCEKCL